jgi:hypothetical protein
MFDACPHPKGTMVIPMLWRISAYVVCMKGVKNENHHTIPTLSVHAPKYPIPNTQYPIRNTQYAIGRYAIRNTLRMAYVASLTCTSRLIHAVRTISGPCHRISTT